jgi:glycosyltransferase involved in cell wall biosynthesis
MMKERMKHCRVYVYGGTWPACYTLSLIEAMMTGIPVVAIGKGLAHSPQYEKFDFYEVDEIIQSGVNGFVGNSVSELRQHINSLLGDDDLAESISAKSRKTAIEYFGKQKIGEQWKDLLIKTKNVN